MLDLKEIFDKYHDDFLKFGRVEGGPHSRPDLCAFLLLDRLLPNPGQDMVCAAEHDEIFLDADCDRLSEVATEDDILMLVRCGVRYDEGTEGLAMFA